MFIKKLIKGINYKLSNLNRYSYRLDRQVLCSKIAPLDGKIAPRKIAPLDGKIAPLKKKSNLGNGKIAPLSFEI